MPVLVHLLVQNPEEVSRMVERLESLDGVMGIELGLPPGADKDLAADLVNAAVGELPVIARLPFEHSSQLAPALTTSSKDKDGPLAAAKRILGRRKTRILRNSLRRLINSTTAGQW